MRRASSTHSSAAIRRARTMRSATRSSAQRSVASRSSATVFARTSASHPLGKCTEAVKTFLPEEIKDELSRKSRELGYGSESEYVRELVIVALRGMEYLTSLHAERLERMSQNLTGKGKGLGL